MAADSTQIIPGQVFNPTSTDLYCICRQPETLDMICCDHCNEWFHTGCFGIDLRSIENIETFPFSCRDCEKKLKKKRFIKEKSKVAAKSKPQSPKV